MAVAAVLVFGGVAVVRWSGRTPMARRSLEAQESLVEPLS
jgi:hypothetical protein